LNCGVQSGKEMVSILLYADDIVLIADSPAALQLQLDALHDWCRQWRLELNQSKTSVMVFRRPSQTPGSHSYTCGDIMVETVSSYKYLGLLLNETLDWDKTVKVLAKSASRALGVVIAKSKASGGFDYYTYTHLYDAAVRPILEYGAEIWGHKEYSSLNAVFNHACRSFMGVGRYCPVGASSGDMGWIPPSVRQHVCVARSWSRLSKMPTTRLTRRICDVGLRGGQPLRSSWCGKTKKLFSGLGLEELIDIDQVSTFSKSYVTNVSQKKAFSAFETLWREKLHNDNRKNTQSRNKLRTYRLFKNLYCPEIYLTHHLNPLYRRAYSKFWCGIAPLRVETDRYIGRDYVPVDKRTCIFCEGNLVEDECHVLCVCPQYEQTHEQLFDTASMIEPRFRHFNVQEKFVFLMSHDLVFRDTAKTCYNILQKRSDLIGYDANKT
jgi:hypothetical protein